MFQTVLGSFRGFNVSASSANHAHVLDWLLLAGSEIEEQQSKPQYQNLISKQSIYICIRYFI